MRTLTSTGLLALVAAAGMAHGQNTTESPVGRIVPYLADTGWLDNATNEPVVVAAFPIIVEDTAWIRAYLENVNLPEGSSVRFTSMTDGETQDLTRKGLTIWSDSSAYFNGDTLLVELIAGPNTFGNRIQVKRLGIDPIVRPTGSPGQCGIVGGVDDRTLSSETWAGRIMPIGCTGSVYCNTGGGMVTAGHCVDGQSGLVVQFNVPASQANCNTVAPPVADQFPMGAFLFANGGVGNDWAVYNVGANNLGQTPFQRYNTFRPIAPAPSAANAVGHVWGYGVDTTCTRSQVQQYSPGTIRSLQTNFYEFFNDIRGGNSGSSYLNNNNEMIGIVSHCRNDGAFNLATRIDLPAFVSARNTLNPCGGGGGSPPANNACANAISVGIGNHTGTTLLATNDATGTCGQSATSPDVWYSLTVGCAATYTITTCGSSYDTVLGLYSACGGSVIACNDDHAGAGCPSGLDSAITTALTAGSYRIRVAGYNGATGNFNLSIAATGAGPANDSCSSAQTALAGIPYTGSTACATNDGSANCASSGTSPDVWYAFTATCTGTAVIDTEGSAYDTALSVHSGCPGTTANQLACDDDSGTGLLSSISLGVTSGTTYYIRVNGFNNATGNYRLNINDCTPDNNNCLAAIAVGEGATPFSTINATTDGPSEPTNCNFFNNPQIASDIWYVYSPTCTGTATVSTCGSGYDTELAIYAGTSCPITESSIACNDDACSLQSTVTFPAVAGSSYLIRLGGYNGATGSGTLTVSCAPAGGCPWQLSGCTADQDGDFDVDSDDIVLFFSNFENGDSCADQDNDTDVDSDDVVRFFTLFEQGGC